MYVLDTMNSDGPESDFRQFGATKSKIKCCGSPEAQKRKSRNVRSEGEQS